MTMGDDDQVTVEQRERSGRREQNKAENRTALLKHPLDDQQPRVQQVLALP